MGDAAAAAATLVAFRLSAQTVPQLSDYNLPLTHKFVFISSESNDQQRTQDDDDGRWSSLDAFQEWQRLQQQPAHLFKADRGNGRGRGCSQKQLPPVRNPLKLETFTHAALSDVAAGRSLLHALHTFPFTDTRWSYPAPIHRSLIQPFLIVRHRDPQTAGAQGRTYQ